MPKMTAKYSAARMTALKESLDISGNQEDLYQRLQKAGWFWDSDKKSWWYAPEEAADPATPLIMIRVWADLEVVEEAADEIIGKTKRYFSLVEKSPVYPCRPPKQLEGRVYLKFLPAK
jgi:hypothetical protein